MVALNKLHISNGPETPEEQIAAILRLNDILNGAAVKDTQKSPHRTFSAERQGSSVILTRQAETALSVLRSLAGLEFLKRDRLAISENRVATLVREILNQGLIGADPRAVLIASAQSLSTPFGVEPMELTTWKDAENTEDGLSRTICPNKVVNLNDPDYIFLLKQNQLAHATPEILIRKFWEQFRDACLENGVDVPNDLLPLF